MAKKGIYQKYECVDMGLEYYERVKNNQQTREYINTTFPYILTTYQDYTFSAKNGFENSGRSISQSFKMDDWCQYHGTALPSRLATSTKAIIISVASSYSYGIELILYSTETCKTRPVYSRGTYLTDTIADYGSLPTDGRHTDGYWYVFLKMASDLKCKVNDIWKDIPTGYVNIGGVWKPQAEFKANVQGIYK